MLLGLLIAWGGGSREVCVSIQCLWSPEEGDRSPEAGATGRSELPNLGAGR